MADNCKVYQDRRRGVWYVQLWWKGKRHWRGHYDTRIKKMTQDVATQLASAINTDIDKKGRAFDPRQWFTTPGYEFQFDLYAEKWLIRKLHKYAPSVRRDISRYVGYATEYWGKTDIREIRDYDIELFLEEGIPQHLSPKTKHIMMGHLRKVFRDAKMEKMPEFPRVEVPEKEVKWITREWQNRILAEIPERDRPIFQLMAAWGVRPGEARSLMWEDIDFENEIITIRRTFSGSGCNHLQPYTKTRRVRYLPFTDELRTSLKKLRGIGGFVFRNSKGRPYTADLSRIWNDARSKAGAPPVTLYQGVRHSFATQHLDQLELVRIVLGHTNSDMTRRYQGVNVDKVRELLPPADRKRNEGN